MNSSHDGPHPQPTVYIVDDDAGMRSALSRLLQHAGMRTESFASAQAFLGTAHLERPGCLLLDVRMPGMSGLDLQQQLKHDGVDLPIIFLTGHGNVAAAVGALKLGAMDFLEKPFDNEVLLERVRTAIEMNAAARLERCRHDETARSLARLTRREREVMEMLAAGKPNKAIAGLLGMGVRTVETHRANIMAKMQADSLSDLIRMSLDHAARKQDR